MRSKLILGTVQFGLSYGINNKNGLLPEEKVNDILLRAGSLGITTLDTAAAYGEAEKRIGTFHKRHDLYNIITKFSKIEGESWETSLKNSLEKMNLSCVDTVMFHSYSAFIENKDMIPEIIRTSKGRLFKKLGVSVYTNSELIALKEMDEVDVVQMPFNMLDNEQNRGAVLRDLKRSGKEIHTRSCFLQGLFFMDEKNLPENLKPLQPCLEQINNIAKEKHIETGHLALQYVLNKKYIDGVLFGIDSIKQLEQNIYWANNILPEEIFNQIDNIKVPDTTLLNPSVWQITR